MGDKWDAPLFYPFFTFLFDKWDAPLFYSLRIDGDAGDALYAAESGWTLGADQTIGANTYRTYTNGAATALVDTDIAASQGGLLLTGTAGADSLAGGAGNDTLNGGAGNDSLSGAGGNDALDGESGNDTLDGGAGDDSVIWDAADGSVNGGAGTDTLTVNGSGVTLDLTTIADNVVTNIEVIDLTGTGNNTLLLTRTDVLAISSTTDTLRIDGDAGDVLTAMDSDWTWVGDQTIGANTYHAYANGVATVLFDTDIVASQATGEGFGGGSDSMAMSGGETNIELLGQPQSGTEPV